MIAHVMRVFFFFLSLAASILVTMTVTDLHTHVRAVLLGEQDKPQHRTLSLTPKEEDSLLDKGRDTIADMFGMQREKPKSDLQKLMERRRKEIAREKNRAAWQGNF